MPEHLSPIRKVRCFIPPSHSPALTIYSRSLLPILTPLKQKYGILSKCSEKPGKQMNPETVVLSSGEVDIVNNLYVRIKKSRGQSLSFKETSYVKDPLYKSIYNLKKQANKMQRNTSRQMKKSSSFLEF